MDVLLNWMRNPSTMYVYMKSSCCIPQNSDNVICQLYLDKAENKKFTGEGSRNSTHEGVRAAELGRGLRWLFSAVSAGAPGLVSPGLVLGTPRRGPNPRQGPPTLEDNHKRRTQWGRVSSSPLRQWG